MRKFIIVGATLAALVVPSAAMASGGPTSGPVAGPGNSCFGNWRAGTVDAFHDVASDWAKGDGFIAGDKVHMNDYNAFGKGMCAAA